MAIHFIDNYPKNNLESVICKSDGTPLYGEIWVYQELQKINERGHIKDETWYVKHNYNLSQHPSANKAEGQIDFLVLNKFGILIIEVKGGGIEVDENDVYYSYDKKDKQDRYESQNPFLQAKQYVHSLRNLIDTAPFTYRAVIFPHEAGFELKGPQLNGYKHLFFSKRDLDAKDTIHGKSELFFQFMVKLPKEARRVLIRELNPGLERHLIEDRMWRQYPELKKQDILRLKAELFPIQTTYGFNPERIRNEIILEENYEILNGLRRNRKVLVQGGPGTGKTVLAIKFLADKIIKQQRGIYFCANKLLRSKMEYWAYEEFKLDRNLIQFRIFSKEINIESFTDTIDFVIIDEAQEFFDKGLFEIVEALDRKNHHPRWLILYDPEQAIVLDFKDIDWYADYFVGSEFVHYFFDTVWRCCQEKAIGEMAIAIKNGDFRKSLTTFNDRVQVAVSIAAKIEKLYDVIQSAKKEFSKWIVLVESTLFEEFKLFAQDYFPKDLEELNEQNINIKKSKLRYTTPIKFRGLESDSVVLITTGFNDQSRIQNYIAITRAIYQVHFITWS